MKVGDTECKPVSGRHPRAGGDLQMTALFQDSRLRGKNNPGPDFAQSTKIA
jgi:hypothetical protein